jgi:hypothetical protein
MANKRIPDLTPAGSLSAGDLFEVWQSVVSAKVPLSAIITAVAATIPTPYDNMNEASLNITGATSINMTSVGTARIVNLSSSNPAQTIDNITNFSDNARIYFRARPGLDVTFNDTSVGAGNMHLMAPSLTILGNKWGTIMFETRVNPISGFKEFYQLTFIDQYV